MVDRSGIYREDHAPPGNNDDEDEEREVSPTLDDDTCSVLKKNWCAAGKICWPPLLYPSGFHGCIVAATSVFSEWNLTAYKIRLELITAPRG